MAFAIARRTTSTPLIPLATAPLLLGAAVWLATAIASAQSAPTGSIAGAVTADRGEVRGLRVKARHTVNRIAYTVFTNRGRYQIYHLPPGPYEVQVVEEAFESPVQKVELRGGQTTTVNVSLKGKDTGAGAGAGSRGSIAQTSYGRTPDDSQDASKVTLVDFDQLYPPGHARDLMLKNCFPCHGISGWHGRVMNKTGWTRVVNRMFAPDGRVANMAVGVPQVTYNRVSQSEKEEIIDYLVANFGPGAKPRDLRVDSIVRDEAELAQAIYIQYELDRSVLKNRKFANNLTPSEGGHSAFVSLSEPGIVYMSGNSSNSIVRVNTRDPNFTTRTREYWIDNPGNINVTPHGIVEREGRVWFVELGGDRVSELDPKSGKIERHRIPTEGGGPHSVWPDSKGNLWYTHFAAAGKIARYDPKTRQVREWEPIKDFSGYGIVVDKQDRVWAVGLNTAVILGYDPKTDKWTSYPIANPARRVTLDSKGSVWVCEYFGNKIAMLDPATGKVTEYELPLKFGNPYDIWPDSDDNLWIENAVYNSLVKFDPRTKKFTYVPFPEFAAHTPKLDRDKEGTLWFTLASPRGLASFKPKGNAAPGAGAAGGQ
jgi:streptogramin lyase